MSEGIKRMLAERAALEAARQPDAGLAAKWERIVAATMRMIDKAAPFMDEAFDGKGWRPSEKLKICYFVASTSGNPGAEKRALVFIQQMLERGRRLWVNGFHPDPWAEEPKIRLEHCGLEAPETRRDERLGR